jgi:K+-sensing histidine kinase KdpD
MPTELESSQDDHQETESVIICICQSGMSGQFVQHASNLLARLTESQYHVQFVNQTLIR